MAEQHKINNPKNKHRVMHKPQVVSLSLFLYTNLCSLAPRTTTTTSTLSVSHPQNYINTSHKQIHTGHHTQLASALFTLWRAGGGLSFCIFSFFLLL